MSDGELLKALCSLAGADSDVTLEEQQLLGLLAGHAGLDRASFNAMVAKARDDEDIHQHQVDVVMRDVTNSMNELMNVAREVGAFGDAHMTMLLWRVATMLEIDAARFEEMLATAQGGS
jgi:hypothetical protein